MMPETPVALIVDDDRDRAELYASWLDGECSVRVAHDAPGALDAFDDDIDVVVLVSPGPDPPGDVLSPLRTEAPGVRVVVVRDGDADLAALARAPDEILPTPVPSATLRRTVATLAAERAYARGVRDLFSLARKRAAIESDDAAGADDAGDLDARIDALRDRLDGTLDDPVEGGGFDAVYRALVDAPPASDDGPD